jgi:N-methylhydantoinase A
MLLADRTRDYSVGALGVSDYEARFRKLEKQAKKDVPRATLERFADVRYTGQSYELTIPFNGNFHQAHRRIYGYSDPKRATQLVTLRVRATVRVEKPTLRGADDRTMSSAAEIRRVWIEGRWREITASPREGLGARAVRGPALITDYGSTTLDRAGSLILRRD